MIGTEITIRNHDTGESIVLNDHATDAENVIALQSFPTFEADIRANNVEKLGAHGEFRMPYYYSGRSVVLRGVIVGEDEAHVWAIKEKFDRIMSLSTTGYGKEASSTRIEPELATNEATNPNALVSTLGWAALDAALTRDGNLGFKVVADDTVAAVIEHEITPEGADGDEYHAAMDVKNDADDARSFTLKVEAFDVSDMALGDSEATETIESGETVRIHTSLTLPVGTDHIIVSVQRDSGSGAAASDEFHARRLLVVKDPPESLSPETSYFDGETLPTSLLSYAWEGARGLSASKEYRMSFPSIDRNTIRLSFTDPAGRRIFLDATPVRSVSYDRRLKETFRLDFQVVVRSNFPYLLIEDENPLVYFGELGSLAEGFQLPTEIPFDLAGSFVSGEMTIDAETPSIASVYMYGSDDGVIVNPKITNLTNGTYVKVLQPLAGSHRFFAINGVFGTMKDQGGRDISAYAEGDYIRLEQGENILLYSSDSVIPN